MTKATRHSKQAVWLGVRAGSQETEQSEGKDKGKKGGKRKKKGKRGERKKKFRGKFKLPNLNLEFGEEF